MTLYKFSWVVLHSCVVAILLFKAHGDGSEISVNFLKAPNSTTHLNSATFLFDVLVDGNEVLVGESSPCSRTNITCKLDNGTATDCGGKEVSYSGLEDGNHKFEVCSTASPGVHCSTYNWIVDTRPPIAYITSPSSVTNALNVPVNISFTEPCTGEGGIKGFRCSSVNACNLLVHGDGQVIPSSVVTLVPTRKYALLVALSSRVQYGSVTLEMDNNFCSDAAGNKFTKSENSTFRISFDRRNLVINLSSAAPEKLIQLDSGNMSVLATNNPEDLKLYLNFSQPVPISYSDVLESLSTTLGTLVPIRGENLEDQRYGFQVVNIPASNASVRISFDSESFSKKIGNPVSPIEPITFLYDSRRLLVRLITESRRTTKDGILIWILFSKPVIGFNESCNISISGGHLSSFKEINKSTTYSMKIQADGDFVSVNIPENVTEDVFGNKNQAESLKVTHDSEPGLPRVTSAIVTTTFGITCLAQGMLAVTSASLVSSGATQGLSSSLMSNPSSNLLFSLSHIQLVALSRWLPAKWPNKYYDYAKALEWSIPYFKLPWEKEHLPPVNPSSKFNRLEIYPNEQPKEVNLEKAVNMVKRPKAGTQAGDYATTFVSESTKIVGSQYLESQDADGWRDFLRSMFWLGVIGGILILLHASVILIIKYRWRCIRSDYGVLTFPRFEIFCIVVALPCICKASTGLVRGGEPSGVAVGTLMLGVAFLILLSFFLFLLVGVTLGMLLLYDEDYQDAQEQAKWFLLLRRVVLGPVKRGKWSWKYQSKQVYVTILGPLFEDLRGLPIYMLRQGNPQNLGDAETQDAEAPGRSPYKRRDRIIPFNDNPRKNGHDIIASDDKTEDTRPPGGNSRRNGDDIIAYDDKTEDTRASGSNCKRSGDIIASDDKTESARGPGGNPQYGDDIITEGASFRQKLFSIPRAYYILLTTVRQVIVAILGAAYIADKESSNPTIITLSITCFLLFFVVFLKPFVSKRGLVVEIISSVPEVVLLTLTFLLSVKEFSPGIKSKIDTCMVILPFIGYAVGMLNQCYALYKQIKHLDLPNQESFLGGLKTVFSRFFDFFLLRKLTENWDIGKGETGETAAKNGSSTAKDKLGMKPREPTKSLSSASKQAWGPNDPSSSSGNPSIPPPSKFGRY